MDALLRAVKDKQDIITLSLGQPSGWSEPTVSVLVDRIAASGVVVTAAVGNVVSSACGLKFLYFNFPLQILGLFGSLVCSEPKHWVPRYLSCERRQVSYLDLDDSKAVSLNYLQIAQSFLGSTP